MRKMLMIIAMLGLGACSAQQPKSFTLADARDRYAHLYANMDQAYSDASFNWVDYKPLPKKR